MSKNDYVEKQIQSTAISGGYLDSYITRIMNEIKNTMINVLGPKGTDIFISTNRDNNLYFTRDGKEVFNSIHFDDPFAQQLKNLIGQAVNSQADLVGDGTTTVSLIAPMTVLLMRDLLRANPNINVFDFKRSAHKILDDLKDKFNGIKKGLVYKDSTYESLIYTTTGDESYYSEIKRNIEDITSNTLIDVVLNDTSNEIVYEINKEPKIETTLLFSEKTLPRDKDGKAILYNSTILFVDGRLDINNWRTLALLKLMKYDSNIENVVIICASMSDEMGDAIRNLKTEFLSEINDDLKDYLSNIVILRLPDYMGYKKEDIIDMETLIYNCPLNKSISAPLDFPQKLHKILMDALSGNQYIDPNLLIRLKYQMADEYSVDEEIKNYIMESLRNPCKIEISLNDTRIHRKSTKEVEERIKIIRNRLNATTSIIDKQYYINRLQKFESDRLVVKIGADIIANAQKKTELMLDALKASKVSLEKGIIEGGSLIHLYNFCKDVNDDGEIGKFFRELSKGIEYILSRIYSSKEVWGKVYYRGEYKNEDFRYKIVEPIASIFGVIDAIKLGVDIGMSNVYTVKGFLNNYI